MIIVLCWQSLFLNSSRRILKIAISYRQCWQYGLYWDFIMSYFLAIAVLNHICHSSGKCDSVSNGESNLNWWMCSISCVGEKTLAPMTQSQWHHSSQNHLLIHIRLVVLSMYINFAQKAQVGISDMEVAQPGGCGTMVLYGMIDAIGWDGTWMEWTIVL